MADPFDPFREDEDVQPDNPPTPPKRRTGYMENGQRYSNEDAIRYSEALQHYRHNDHIPEALKAFFNDANASSYRVRAAEQALFPGVYTAIANGYPPGTPEFDKIVSDYAGSAEAQQALKDIDIAEFFSERQGTATENDAGYESFLNTLGSDDMAKLREAYDQYNTILGEQGDITGLNSFGGLSTTAIRQMLLNEGPDAFRNLIAGNVNAQRDARTQALDIAKALGIEGEYEQNNNWVNALANLQARQAYQTEFDKFKDKPRVQAKDQRRIQGLYDTWQGMPSPFQPFMVNPYQFKNPAGTPFQTPTTPAPTTQNTATNPAAGGGAGLMGGAPPQGAVSSYNNPFSAFQAPSQRRRVPQPTQQQPTGFWGK